jgi:hypothetical protein
VALDERLPCFERHRPGEFDAARQRTEAEDRALELWTLADHLARPSREQHAASIADLRDRHAEQVAKAHDGQYGLPIGES